MKANISFHSQFGVHYLSLAYSSWQTVNSVNLGTLLIPYIPQKYKITGVMEKRAFSIGQ
jgi:hypothetical protein